MPPIFLSPSRSLAIQTLHPLPFAESFISHPKHATPLIPKCCNKAKIKLAFLFDRFGTANSAFHLTLAGQDRQNTPKKIHFELTAKNGDGPYIPCTPAILLCNKLAAKTLTFTGATPCVGLITKDEYLTALSELAISWEETRE